MVSGVIFDMDGLMFDSEAIWASCWERVLPQYGYKCTLAFLRDSLGVYRTRQEEIIREYCAPDVPADEIYLRTKAMVDAVLMHDVPKKPGLDELLAWLSSRDIPMAVASSSAMHQIEAYLQTAGVRRYFSAVVSGADVVHSKPAPDIFLEAAQRLDIAPANTLVLEDSYAGVRAGVSGGFITVMVPDLVQPTEDLSRAMNSCCESLFDVIALLESGRL